jgi:Mrp family chromosome partitioning ATPase
VATLASHLFLLKLRLIVVLPTPVCRHWLNCVCSNPIKRHTIHVYRNTKIKSKNQQTYGTQNQGCKRKPNRLCHPSPRTSLHFAMLEAKNNVMMISGASPGVGKSFVSTNLAAVIAQAG